MDIEIKQLTGKDLDDFAELIKLFEDVFERENFTLPAKSHLQNILNKANFLTFVAKAYGKVLGGITVYMLEQYYAEKPLAYIYDLAVLNKYQRKGIGKKLIEHLVAYCKENGFEEIYVQAEKADTHAVDFYRSTNISGEEQVVHFYYLLDESKGKDKN